jgi:hypothetical protein
VDDSLLLEKAESMHQLCSELLYELHVEAPEILESHEFVQIVRQELETDAEVSTEFKAVNDVDHMHAVVRILHFCTSWLAYVIKDTTLVSSPGRR